MAFHIDTKSKKVRLGAVGIVGFFIAVASLQGGQTPEEEYEAALLAAVGSDGFHVLIAHNATVSEWTDVSTGANSVVQATGANQPSINTTGFGPNSRASVTFDSTGPEYYRLASGCANLAQDQDAPGVIIVFATSAAGTTRTIADYSCASGVSACVFKPRVTNTNVLRFQGIADGEITDLECNTSTSVDNNINTLNLYEGWMSDTDGQFHVRLNGAGEGTIAVANVDGLVRNREACVQVNIGARMSILAGNQFDGRIGTVVASKNMTAARRAAIIAAAEAFYGVDWTP